jgi:hypothetical protein
VFLNKEATKLISAAVLKRVFVVCVVLSLAGGAAASDVQVSEIWLQSTTGYGHHRFTLKIHNDAEVKYLGQNFVDVKGRRTSRISRADFNKLVTKIQTIGFLQLENHYDRYPLDKPAKTNRGIAEVESTIVTDQPSQIVTVVALNGTKRVEDRMGAPKGLRELEELIVDVTNAARWIGPEEDVHDIPYYESFPLNRSVTFRVLLEHYRTGGDPKKISGYLLMFMKNNGVSFEAEASHNIDLSKFDGYIVDVTGQIKQSGTDHVFAVTDIRRVRRYH